MGYEPIHAEDRIQPDDDVYVPPTGYLAIRGAMKRAMARHGRDSGKEKRVVEFLDDYFEDRGMDNVKKGVVGVLACLNDLGDEGYSTFIAELSREGRLDRATEFFAYEIVPRVIDRSLPGNSFVGKALAAYLISEQMPEQRAGFQAGSETYAPGLENKLPGSYIMPMPDNVM